MNSGWNSAHVFCESTWVWSTRGSLLPWGLQPATSSPPTKGMLGPTIL